METSEKKWMQLALEEAKKGLGRTSPNPPVGAVLVKDGVLLGLGWHKKSGEAHAELNALADATEKGNSLQGSTLYVTLEPCCHFGKTPPCTDAVIKAGISKVVIGAIDKNAQVAGKGVQALKHAGIIVESGMLKEASEELLRFFNCFITKRRPYFIHKGACSLDGKTATASGESQWITSKQSREEGHRLRNSLDAILIGAGTFLADNPRLTTRLLKQESRNPLRLILNPSLKLPENRCKLFDIVPQQETIFFYDSLKANKKNKALIEGAGCRTHPLQTDKEGGFQLDALSSFLHSEGVCSVLLEGGADTIARFYKAELVDEASFFIAPMLIGGEAAPGLLGRKGFHLNTAPRLRSIVIKSCGEDMMITGKVFYSKR